MRKAVKLAIGVALAVLVIGGGAYVLSAAHRTPAPGQIGDGVSGPRDMVWIPGGEFRMGSESARARPNERPAHAVRIDGFWMDRHHVTNREFAAFVAATGYLTTAERKPTWESIAAQLPEGTPRLPDAQLVPGAVVFVGTSRPVSLDDYTRWWRFVPGANWRHPRGPDSNIDDLQDHPVVQVSYEDAQAYAKWVGKRLPTEAEWEFAARGGLEQANFAWGNRFRPDDQAMAKVWDDTKGAFPLVQSPRIVPGTAPVGRFPANGYKLLDMAGNAWQWVADWYRSDAFARQASAGKVVVNPRGPAGPFDVTRVRPDAPQRVIRGGSFLCNEDYCEGYRVSARQGQDPSTGSANVGFRLVADADR